MLPRRALVAIASTAVAIVLLLNFTTPAAPTSPIAAIISSAASPNPVSQLAPAGPSAAPGAQSGSGAQSGASSGSANGSTSAPAANQAPTGRTASYKTGTYAGPAVQIPFGTVQVRVTISGGRITQVQELQMPSMHARSAQISQIVAPMLEQQVLQAQSAQIDGVSGATYTSQAYAQSIQGALDQAHA